MRLLLEKSREGNRRAALAIDVFCYRIKKYIGMYAAVLGRLDAVVFTGGIGENAVPVRAAACSGLDCLGIAIDQALNEQMVGRREGAISSPQSGTAVLVVPTDEEAAIADDTYQIVRQRSCPIP